MCLGTFSRLARSLTTVYIFARVRIFGTSVPFYVTGNSCYIIAAQLPDLSGNCAAAAFRPFLFPEHP